MNPPKPIAGIGEIADLFDVFLLDQFGVLHDGRSLYPGAIDALENLYAVGKKLVILTNSGKRATPNLERLTQLGVPARIIAEVVSSGEVAWCGIRDANIDPRFVRGARAFVVGKSGENYDLGDLSLCFVDTPEKADIILMLGSDEPSTSIKTYAALLRAAAESGVPALCANPDLVMFQAGGLARAPGAIANIYRELGGEVLMIGKPHGAIYRHARALAPNIPVDRIVAVGDSVEHDIRGASAAGIASVFVRGGICSDRSPDQLNALFSRQADSPTYVTPKFAW